MAQTLVEGFYEELGKTAFAGTVGPT